MLHSSLICISTSVHNALTHPCPSGENPLIFKIQVSSPPSMKLFWSCSSFILLYMTSMCFKLSHHTPAAAAKSLQLWPTLCDPIDSSPPGSPVPGIFQERVLEWVAIALSVIMLLPQQYYIWHITDLFFDMLSFQDYTCLKGRRHLVPSESLQCSAAQQDFLSWLKHSLALPNAVVTSCIVFCGFRTWGG